MLVRLALFSLPPTLLLVDFGGPILLAVAALGGLSTYIFGELRQHDACFGPPLATC